MIVSAGELRNAVSSFAGPGLIESFLRLGFDRQESEELAQTVANIIVRQASGEINKSGGIQSSDKMADIVGEKIRVINNSLFSRSKCNGCVHGDVCSYLKQLRDITGDWQPTASIVLCPNRLSAKEGKPNE